MSFGTMGYWIENTEKIQGRKTEKNHTRPASKNT
jgi:hypothetical protein